jgi:hypothetical protein
MLDPDKGTMTYDYNALGELISQVDAKVSCPRPFPSPRAAVRTLF